MATSFTLPASNSSAWCSNTTEECVNQILLFDSNDNQYGVYYNWRVATAGTGTYLTPTGQNAPSSICSRGWRLPTGGSAGELKSLGIQYNSSASLQDVPGFILGGIRDGNTVSGRTIEGGYWSSTSNGNVGANRLSLNTTGMNDESNHYKYTGESIHCVAQ